MVSESEIEKQLQKEFADKVEVRVDPEARISVTVANDNLVEVATFMKHELGFIHPNFCTGTDNKDHIEVSWHIGHPESPILLILRTKTDRSDSNVQSLTTIWQGYNWHEREAYDMLGVNFVNHPDLRRLIMPDNWEGHPLREDYVYKKPNYRKLEDLE